MRMYPCPITLPPHCKPPNSFSMHCQGHEWLRASAPPTMRVDVKDGSTAGLPQVWPLGGSSIQENSAHEHSRQVFRIASFSRFYQYKMDCAHTHTHTHTYVANYILFARVLKNSYHTKITITLGDDVQFLDTFHSKFSINSDHENLSLKTEFSTSIISMTTLFNCWSIVPFIAS